LRLLTSLRPGGYDPAGVVSYQITNGFAGVWFRQEKPLRFRAGPAGAAQAFMDCGDMSPLSKRRHVGALQSRTRAGRELNQKETKEIPGLGLLRSLL
jgi:hypothetical protein